MTMLPLSSSDLIRISGVVSVFETDPTFTENPIIGRIEVIRPDGDDVVGHIVREGNPDGSGEAWMGFVGS